MTGVAHLQHCERRGLRSSWISSRIASALALIAGAVILLLGGFALAAHFRADTPPPQELEVPTATSPGMGP